MSEQTLVGEVKLRNLHRVFEDETSFRVVHIDRNGQEHVTSLRKSSVARMRDLLRGRSWTVEAALQAVGPEAESLKLMFTSGWKANFEVQEALVVMVALGQARYTKVSRSYVYEVT